MRWGLIAILAVLALVLPIAPLPAAYAAAPAWGCCATDAAAGCFDGSVIGYQPNFNAFRDRCKESLANQDVDLTNPATRAQYILGEGSWATCLPAQGPSQVCEKGCCCHEMQNPKTGEETTRKYCDVLKAADPANDKREFKSRVAGLTCDQICAGTTSTTPTTSGTYRVSGIVVQKGTSPEAPLKDVVVALSFANNPANKATTDAAGRFALPNPVAAGTRVRFVATATSTTVPSTCRPAAVEQDVAGTITTLKIEMDCSPAAVGACTNPAPSVSNFAADQGAASVSFKLAITDTCRHFRGYEVIRCEKRGGVIDRNTCAYRPTTSTDYTDAGLRENTEYCYTVKANFDGGTPLSTEASGFTTSAPRCIRTGVARCMSRTTGTVLQWCGTSGGQQAVFTCDDDNLEREVKKCASGTVCAQEGNSADCAPIPACGECNGLLGLFSKLPLQTSFQDRQLTCAAMADVNPAIARCYKDEVQTSASISLAPIGRGELGGEFTTQQKASIVPVYNSCASITDCAAYASPSACAQNACGVTGASGTPETCRWVTLNRELGLGVCSGTTRPSCSACGQHGTCTKDVCEAISADCYFDNDRNELGSVWYPDGVPPRCLPKSEMACRYYDTREDCIGSAGQAAAFSVQYENGKRVGGSNARTADSADKLGLKVCSWFPGTTTRQGYCFKNADQSPAAEDDDCIQNGVAQTNRLCVRDRTPPVTRFIARTPAEYGLHEIGALPFTVTDDTTPADEIKTYLCFAPAGGAPCYPRELAKAVTTTGIEDGTYAIVYYSEDKNGNVERLNTNTITVTDLGFATLQKIEIASAQSTS